MFAENERGRRAQNGARLGGNGWAPPRPPHYTDDPALCGGLSRAEKRDRLPAARTSASRPTPSNRMIFFLAVGIACAIAFFGAVAVGEAIARSLVRPEACSALSAAECAAWAQERGVAR